MWDNTDPKSTLPPHHRFDSMDETGNGEITLREFQNGRGRSPFLKALVENTKKRYGAGSAATGPETFKIDAAAYDFARSTAENYEIPLSEGFVDQWRGIRKDLDYSYHCNYAHARQQWQDDLIQKCVLLAGSQKQRPWLVHTCGPMGAGKGHVLGWMSANGHLPVEEIAKIDRELEWYIE